MDDPPQHNENHPGRRNPPRDARAPPPLSSAPRKRVLRPSTSASRNARVSRSSSSTPLPSLPAPPTSDPPLFSLPARPTSPPPSAVEVSSAAEVSPAAVPPAAEVSPGVSAQPPHAANVATLRRSMRRVVKRLGVMTNQLKVLPILDHNVAYQTLEQNLEVKMKNIFQLDMLLGFYNLIPPSEDVLTKALTIGTYIGFETKN
ncbi:lysine-rich arabinogalactan protein 19-like [Macadamia integrifolia]|uniref:lysine-rich arabinogalactan protein 19-like n=1 Tax=Macadamia integrifolia TaxID=60698 RepID=UPI001C4EA3E0|nr:lysine-rich arabinogalactan protein 19-like [Macadamia integrifolia]XP_042485914.1 lysine-rich arabinogalactan protein 19-like [Macadamia integrifolia]XP_042485921.1 lysine-rich arabinogalactan protein 19-like [Macadamia integrifolia]